MWITFQDASILLQSFYCAFGVSVVCASLLNGQQSKMEGDIYLSFGKEKPENPSIYNVENRKIAIGRQLLA